MTVPPIMFPPAPRLSTTPAGERRGEVVPFQRLPAKPALTPGLERLLRAEQVSLTSAEPANPKDAAQHRFEFLGTAEKAWRASPVPEAERAAAEEAMAAFDEYLRPQDWETNARAMRAVAVLLSYYRQPDRALEMEEDIAGQWGEDIEEYPLWAVEEACRIWRRTPDNRRAPYPGEIRAMCERLVVQARQQRDRLRRCLEMPSLIAAPRRLTTAERTALDERRQAERAAAIARLDEVKARLVAEGKWPGSVATPASAPTPAPSTNPDAETKAGLSLIHI